MVESPPRVSWNSSQRRNLSETLRDWHSAGLAERPGNRKPYHHLGPLSQEVESEQLRVSTILRKGMFHILTARHITNLYSIYLSIYSMTTLPPSPRRASPSYPSGRLQPGRPIDGVDACVPDLFVLLHGMLFINVLLDDFQPTLSRSIERLRIGDAEGEE